MNGYCWWRRKCRAQIDSDTRMVLEVDVHMFMNSTPTQPLLFYSLLLLLLWCWSHSCPRTKHNNRSLSLSFSSSLIYSYPGEAEVARKLIVCVIPISSSSSVIIIARHVQNTEALCYQRGQSGQAAGGPQEDAGLRSVGVEAEAEIEKERWALPKVSHACNY